MYSWHFFSLALSIHSLSFWCVRFHNYLTSTFVVFVLIVLIKLKISVWADWKSIEWVTRDFLACLSSTHPVSLLCAHNLWLHHKSHEMLTIWFASVFSTSDVSDEFLFRNLIKRRVILESNIFELLLSAWHLTSENIKVNKSKSAPTFNDYIIDMKRSVHRT